MKGKMKLAYGLLTAIFLAVYIFPLVILILWSFAKNWPWPRLLPGDFTLRGWRYLLDPKSRSLGTLLFSIGLSSVVTALTLIISVPAARALALYKFRWKKLIEVLIFAPVIVPTAAIAMGVHTQFIKMGLANRFIGVVLIHIIPCIPYSVRIMKNVFEIVGEDMDMQAKVLGANPLQTLIFVTLPMIMPGILSAASMVFIVSFSQYIITFLIGGGRMVTFSMLMFPYIQNGDRTMGAVYSIVFIMTTIVFLLIIERSTNRFYKDRLKEYYYV